MDILPGASRFFWSPPFYLSDGSGRDLSALSVASRSPAVFLANLELKFADAMFAAAILENVRAWREVLHLLYIASPNGWRIGRDVRSWLMITYSTNTTYTVHVNKNCFGFMLLPYFTQIYLSYLGLWQGWLYTCVYEDVLMKYFTNCVSSYNWYFGDLFLFSTTLHIPKGCANWQSTRSNLYLYSFSCPFYF